MFRPTTRVDNAHASDVWAVVWRGESLLSAGLDGTVRHWQPPVCKPEESSASPTQLRMGITSVAISSDGSTGVSCNQNSSIKFYELPMMQEVGSIEPGLLEAWTVCISPDDACIAAGTQHGNVNIWSIQEKEKIATLRTGGKFVMSCDFNAEGTRIACSGIDGKVHVFDIHTGKVIHAVEAHALPARSIAFNGNLIYTASDDKHVTVMDVSSGTIVNSFAQSGIALSVSPSMDQRHFVVGCSNHTVYLWDLGMQRYQQQFNSQHSDQVWGVSFNKSDPLGKQFVSVGEDGVLQLYEKS